MHPRHSRQSPVRRPSTPPPQPERRNPVSRGTGPLSAHALAAEPVRNPPAPSRRDANPPSILANSSTDRLESQIETDSRASFPQNGLTLPWLPPASPWNSSRVWDCRRRSDGQSGCGVEWSRFLAKPASPKPYSWGLPESCLWVTCICQFNHPPTCFPNLFVTRWSHVLVPVLCRKHGRQSASGQGRSPAARSASTRGRGLGADANLDGQHERVFRAGGVQRRADG